LLSAYYPVFRLQLQRRPCNTHQERYNPDESVPKKEIPIRQSAAKSHPAILVDAAVGEGFDGRGSIVTGPVDRMDCGITGSMTGVTPVDAEAC
jgi:hypothetical protein